MTHHSCRPWLSQVLRLPFFQLSDEDFLSSSLIWSHFSSISDDFESNKSIISLDIHCDYPKKLG